MRTSRPGIAAIMAAYATIFLASCGGSGSDGAPPAGFDPDTGWLIPVSEVFDGGPGRDGIPSIDAPVFQRAADVTFLQSLERVVGVFHQGEYRAYSHNILNWHEVVNDSVSSDSFVLSYCPLTGSSLAWNVNDNARNPQFGVSGLLYNSNLILYDRDSESRWSQMLELAVWGPRAEEVPARIQVIETTWETWAAMYPDSLVLTTNTGYSRDYNAYPYGGYRFNEQLLFPVSNLDNRMHPKERVLGIRSATASKVYQLYGFGTTMQTINDQFKGQPIVAVGNAAIAYGAIFGRELADGTVLTFSPLTDQLPSVMEDTEGNTWDVFGTAVSGPRLGTQLPMTNSYVAMWFAWATFFEDTEIHFN